MNFREKPFREALWMEIKALDADQINNYPKGSMRSIAQALLFRAADGDIAAIREVADRIDGKVPQALGGSDELAPQHITVSWRETPDPNSDLVDKKAKKDAERTSRRQ